MYKLFVMDVDGTMTDGKVYMSSQGEAFKAFDVKDGYGIKHILPQLGIKPAIITGRYSEIVKRRAEELDIKLLFQGVGDKRTVLEELMKQEKCNLSEVAYVGDDLNDLECIEAVGFSACPQDAYYVLKNKVDYVACCRGGNGAIREVIDFIHNSLICGGK